MAQTPKNTTSQTPAVSADVTAFLKMYEGMSAGQKAALTKSIPDKDGMTIQGKAAARAAATRAARTGIKLAKTPVAALPVALAKHLGIVPKPSTAKPVVKPDVSAALAILKRIQSSK